MNKKLKVLISGTGFAGQGHTDAFRNVGACGVVASDFMQTLVVAVISIACAVVALVKVGGPAELINNFPADFVIGPNMNYPLLLVGTFVFFLAKQLVTIMNLHDSFRFLTA